MKARTIISTCMLSLLIWTFSLSQASAVSLVTYENNYSSGVWTYSMTVENHDADPLYDLKVDVGTDDLPGLIVYSPSGWGNPIDIGNNYIHWMADFGNEVNAGDPPLPGFFFTYTGTSTDDIGSIRYHTTTWHDDGFGGNLNSACTGNTGSPSDCTSNTTVPEPGTLLLVLSGMMVIIFIRHKRGYYFAQ